MLIGIIKNEKMKKGKKERIKMINNNNKEYQHGRMDSLFQIRKEVVPAVVGGVGAIGNLENVIIQLVMKEDISLIINIIFFLKKSKTKKRKGEEKEGKGKKKRKEKKDII